MELLEGAKLTGGKLYNEGGYGCVFVPPLLCKGETKKDADKIISEGKYIDKLMSKNFANIEFAIAKRIHTIPLWKNYFLVPHSICEPAPESLQMNSDIQKCGVLKKDNNLKNYRILRMTFGGKPLTQITMDFKKHSFVDFFKHLIEGGALMNLFGVVHRDLHRNNILVDTFNVPRIIDFNLSIDVQKPVNKALLLNVVEPDLVHEPPDSYLLNGLYSGYDFAQLMKEFFKKRKSLSKIQSILKVPKEKMEDDFREFYRKSKSAQNEDIEKWFQSYWRTIDSWAIGIDILITISYAMMWHSFEESDFKKDKTKIFEILTDMLQINPMKRIDCVEALNRLDPENYIIRKYGGKWLSRVKHGGALTSESDDPLLF